MSAPPTLRSPAARAALLALLVVVVVVVVVVAAPRTSRAQPRDAAAVSADASAAASAAYDAALAQGRDALESGALDRARALLEPVARDAPARVAAQAWFYLGDLAEHALRFADALAAYRASLARDPGGRYAARALARVEYLEARREGDFAPLAALERVRNDPARASDPAAIAELARAARAFPPGPVRGEARLLAGQAYAGRLHRPREAAAVLRELADDPGAPTELRRLGTELLAQVREQTGEYGTGLAEVRALGGDPRVAERLARLARREVLYRAARVVAVLVLVAGLWALARLARRRRLGALWRALRRPLPLAHIAMLAVGGGLLAHTYDEHEMSPFFALGAGATLVYVVATAWSAAGSPRAAARVGRAAACALGMLAVSFLVMYRFDAGMLEGIGL